VVKKVYFKDPKNKFPHWKGRADTLLRGDFIRAIPNIKCIVSKDDNDNEYIVPVQNIVYVILKNNAEVFL